MNATDIAREILTSPFGSFGFIFALLTGAGFLIYYVTKKVTIITFGHDNLQGSVNRIEGKLDTANADVVYLKGVWAAMHVDDMRRDMLNMQTSIDTLISGKQFFKSKSPLSLTDSGIEVAKNITAGEIIDKNWNHIYAILDREICDKNAYDIQQYCLEDISLDPDRFFAQRDLNFLKDYAFKTGMSLAVFTKIIGLMIRDRYLELKGIPIEEIDIYDPTGKKAL